MKLRFIPSLFTILNLFCGFMSLVHSANANLEQACLFIIYAALFDALDGIVARFTRTSSKFGVELDSLADTISFGAAPSFLLYKFYFYRLDGPGIALAALIMIFAALRLARFNAQLIGFDKNYFSGLPVPASALTIASFFLFYYNRNFSIQASTIFAYVLCILLPVLMVSKLKYDTLPKFSKYDFKIHPVKTILVSLILLLVVVTKGEGLFAFCLFYLSTGPIRFAGRFFKKNFWREQKHIPEEILNSKL